MLIMGVDPGTAITGFGVVNYRENLFSMVGCGCIRTLPDKTIALRLKTLYDELTKAIKLYNPDHFAVEELFFNKNTRTALAVGQARGICILAAADSGLPVYEYTPLQVKKAVAGFGKAEKRQVQFMVKCILSLKTVPEPDDVADALAIAICHANQYSWEGKIG